MNQLGFTPSVAFSTRVTLSPSSTTRAGPGFANDPPGSLQPWSRSPYRVNVGSAADAPGAAARDAATARTTPATTIHLTECRMRPSPSGARAPGRDEGLRGIVTPDCQGRLSGSRRGGRGGDRPAVRPQPGGRAVRREGGRGSRRGALGDPRGRDPPGVRTRDGPDVRAAVRAPGRGRMHVRKIGR